MKKGRPPGRPSMMMMMYLQLGSIDKAKDGQKTPPSHPWLCC
jgi:hypothetical protein